MTIDRLSGIEPVKNVQSLHRPYKTEKNVSTDAISVSQEARLLSEANMAFDVIKRMPDVREDKIAEVAKKLQDPLYINEALLNTVADKILDEYGF
ncbi:MAG: flagellar biosynthesis anti-sigma factor FlgM [Treponema sp.]